MVKKLWNDPVWSKVIAGVILTVVATIGAYFLDWWPSIGSFIWNCYKSIFFTTTTPNWLLGILCILSLPTIVIALALLWEKVHPKKQNDSHSWRSYTTDNYFGLRWRWKYYQDGGIYDVYTFCPHCDFQVFPYDASGYRIIDRIGYQCDSCGRDLGQVDESRDSLENKVIRLIQQKLRTGLWPRQNDEQVIAPDRFRFR
jgi:hypothetical protein